MRKKRFLAAILLGVVLCFVSAVGYGEIPEWMINTEASKLDYYLLWGQVNYMMNNPNSYLCVLFIYDRSGNVGRGHMPVKVNTTGKVLITVTDNRNSFPGKSGIALLDIFKRRLEVIYSFIHLAVPNMDTDIVARFQSREEIPLGYFYQGEYYLWED